MSTSINKVFLAGRLGSDPNVRSLSDGTKVCDFSLATSTGGFTTKEGKEIPEVTQWHRIIAWRHLAELCEKALKKGYSATVLGEITYRTYEKDGITMSATDIIANEIIIGSAPSGYTSANGQKAADPSQYAQPSQSQNHQTAPMQAPVQPMPQEQQNDNLPF